MESLKLWVLGGIVLVGGIIFGFLAKWFFNEVLDILNDIKEELKNLTHASTIQEVVINQLVKETNSMSERLNGHDHRIVDIEKHLILIVERKENSK